MRKVLPLWVSIPLVWLAVGIVLGIHADGLLLWASRTSPPIILRGAAILLVAIPLLINLGVFHNRRAWSVGK
jgi:hypothetical protein